MTHEMEMAERALVQTAQSVGNLSNSGSVSIFIYAPQPDILAYAALHGSRYMGPVDDAKDYYYLTFGPAKIIICINTPTDRI